MSQMKAYLPGSFSWIELASTRPGSAKSFYRELLGWSAVDNTSDHGVYTLLQKGGLDVAGLYAAPAGAPSAWTPYFTVADAAEATARARALGAEVVMDTVDVMDHGRMSVLRDPAGATFSVWQARTHIGSRFFGEPGAPCWAELLSSDPARVKPFYTELFGWETDDESMKNLSYTIFQRAGSGAAGLMPLPEGWRSGPSFWMVYLGVEHCDRAAQQVANSGGRVVMGPMDIPAVGRFAYVEDPTGARFAVIQLAEMGQA
jgi:predicted enzyme related to lactoylglutathione lyase